jgi:hypothetical protein
MKHDLFIIAGLILLAYWMIKPSEKFFDSRLYPKERETQAHGTKTDTTSMKDTTDMGIVSDEINTIVQLFQKHFLEKHGICIYVINTNDITRHEGSKGTLHKCTFMCSVLDGDFPYGIGVYLEVLNDKIVYMSGQPKQSFTNIEDEGNFTPFKSIVDFSSQSLLSTK